jgi:pilus assembly protein Flp/PilA
MNTMKNAMVRLINEDEGASAVEYGLLVSLIAVVIFVAVKALGTSAKSTFTTAAGNIASGAN